MAGKLKRDSEHPKVLLTRTLHGFAPATPYDQERLMHYSIGATVEVQVWQKRSLEHLRLYWAVLHQCVDNSENKYGRAEDLHDILKITLGYSRRIRLLIPAVQSGVLDAIKGLIEAARWYVQHYGAGTRAAGRLATVLQNAEKSLKVLAETAETIVLPGSVAFDRMDQAEFKVFFEKAMNELRKAGYPVDDYVEEGKRKAFARQRYIPVGKSEDSSTREAARAN
jgi:hypothetical protein